MSTTATALVDCPEVLPEARAAFQLMLQTAAERTEQFTPNGAYHHVHDDLVATRNRSPMDAHHMRCAGALAITLLGELVAKGVVEVKF